MSGFTVRRDADHAYWSGATRLMGCTESLGIVGAMPGGFYTDQGSVWGTQLHDYCLNYALRQMGRPPRIIPTIEQNLTRAESFVRFCDQYGVKFHVAGEILSYLPMRLAGEPDFVVTMESPGHHFMGRMPLDIKRGAKEKWHPLQLALYGVLDTQKLYGAEYGCTLYLTPTGFDPKFFRLPDHVNYALSMVNTAHWLRANIR